MLALFIIINNYCDILSLTHFLLYVTLNLKFSSLQNGLSHIISLELCQAHNIYKKMSFLYQCSTKILIYTSYLHLG